MNTRSIPQLAVRFPDVDGTPEQDSEWCEVTIDGETRRIRFHDYDEIFDVPGLYEAIFHEHLACTSPTVVVELLGQQLANAGVDPTTLRGLDVGAGNGLVGEELERLGVGSLVGVDLLQEAADAADRDRPGLYDDYVACDLTALSDDERERIEGPRPNLLTTVAALGFGDIPCAAFITAYDAIEDGGWIVFNLKASFLDEADRSGFAGLITGMLEDGVLEELTRRRYEHRRSMTGEALEYVALVGRKRADATLDRC